MRGAMLIVTDDASLATQLHLDEAGRYYAETRKQTHTL